jgi:hypothetical protein
MKSSQQVVDSFLQQDQIMFNLYATLIFNLPCRAVTGGLLFEMVKFLKKIHEPNFMAGER